MCGRYVSKDQASLERHFNLVRGGGDPFKNVYNAAPTLLLPVVRDRRDGGRDLALLRWGLIPYWAKDALIGVKTINARAESLIEKPAFREAFQRRRCLVPMAGFYEWQKTSAGKIPYFIHPLNSELFVVAGLHERWRPKDGGEPIESFAIITTDANEVVAKLHDRMPAILNESDYDKWLDPKNEETKKLQELLVPYPAEEMRAYTVRKFVNSSKNEGPKLIEPAPQEDLFA